MSTSGHTKRFLFCLFFLIYTHRSVYGWDNDDLELFDLVEEVNGNFYELLGVERSSTSSEIRKAYRKKTLVLHPDKNEAEDAEQQFRNLVAVYEVLKDEEKREKYNNVLDNGLPDWRQPVFYYRKARKLGLAELALLLCAVLTVGHYFVMWAVYLEKRLALEDFFESKKKRETKGKRGKAAVINEKLEEDMHSTLQSIPKPSFRRLWPFTFTVWCVRTAVNLPARMRERRELARLEAELREAEKEEQLRLEAEYREEQEQRKLRRSQKRTEPEYRPLCESTAEPVVYGGAVSNMSTSQEEEYKQTIKEGEWTDEDYVLLSKAYIRFPGGTMDRWDKIADMVGRPVSEVTTKCKKMKGNFTMNLSSSVQAGTKNTKMNKVEISDQIISKPSDVGNGSTDTSAETDSTVRRRHKNKQTRDPERTLIIKDGLPDGSGSNSSQITANSNSSKQDVSENGKLILNVKTSNNINSQTSAKKMPAKTVQEPKKKVSADQAASDGPEEDVDQWSQNLQVTFEWALKQFPRGTEQRWEKIASHVPGKTKEECIQRFKYLAELIKQKKQQST